MRKILLFLLFILSGCVGTKVVPPESFLYQEIRTDSYTLASWQKITDSKSPIRIYIEGDGYAFNNYGYPTNNPTPRGTFLRNIAFNDPNPNVVYLGRPCQYVSDTECSQTDWTVGRFSQKIIDSTSQAIKQISKKQPIILIGYSGGGLLSGLVIEQNPNLPVKKWITLAGVLNHAKWTDDLEVSPLTDSVDLITLPNIKQIHFIGDKDDTVSYKMTTSIVPATNLIVIPNATHNQGYENYISLIYDK